MLRGIKAVMISLFAGLCDRLSGLFGGGGVGWSSRTHYARERVVHTKTQNRAISGGIGQHRTQISILNRKLSPQFYPRAPDESLQYCGVISSEFFQCMVKCARLKKILLINFSRINELSRDLTVQMSRGL